MLYGYDYIRPSISAANRSTLDTWFNNAATFWESNTHATVISRFPNRLSDDYTTLGGGATSCLGPGVTHFNGHTNCSFHAGWNNRSGSHLLFAGLAGIVTGNTSIQDKAKRWFREWVRFANFADGTNAEFVRWQSNAPTLGWRYVAVIIAEMATLADAFARIGDNSLFTYSTSLGHTTASLVPAGGPKSLLSIMRLWLQHVDGTVVRYGTDVSANNGNPNYKIDTVDAIDGAQSNADTWIAQANLYYQNSYIKSIYMRTASGAPAYPANPVSGGYCVYCGEWGALPGVLFMFGQMEGKVSPYGGTTSTQVPPAPSTLVIQTQ
jgi:hypothetical protein